MRGWKSSRSASHSRTSAAACALALGAALCWAQVPGAPQETAEQLLLRARQALSSDLAQALDCLGKVLAQEPDNPEAHFLLGQALELRGELRRARAEYEKALRGDERLAEAWLALGRLCLEKLEPADLARAEEALSRAAELAGGRGKIGARALHGLAQLELAQGKSEAALGHLEQAVGADPTLFAARLDLGIELFGQGRYSEAQEELRAAAELERSDPLPWFYLGLLYDALGQEKEALLAYDEALARDPEHRASLYNKAALLERLGRAEEAREAYEKLLQLDPKQADVALKAAELLAKTGKAEQAIASLRRMVRAEPKNVAARAGLAAALAQVGRIAEAKREYLAVLRLDEANEAALRNLGRIAEAEERFDEAARYYAKLRELYPSNDGYALACARGLARVGRRREALDIVKQVAERNSQNIEALRMAARLYMQLGEVQQALDAALRVLDREPGDAGTMSFAAALLERQGRAREAAELYLRAVQASPSDGELRRRCACCLERAGRFSEAAEQYRRAAGLVAGDSEILAGLIRARQAAGEMDKLREDLKLVAAAGARAGELWPELVKAFRAGGALAEGLRALEEVYVARPSAELAAALALGWAEAGEGPRARAIALRVLRSADAAPAAIALAAQALNAADAPDEAALYLLRAVKRNERSAELWCALGEAYVALGNVRQARECFRRALRLKPTCTRARERLAELGG